MRTAYEDESRNDKRTRSWPKGLRYVAERRETSGVASRRGDDAATLAAEDLAGVQQLLRIPEPLDPPLPLEHLGRLLPGHVAGLGDPDPVLARERAAEIERGPEDLAQRGFDPGGHLGIAVVLVGEHVDVQIAVAGVAEGGHEQALARADAVGARQRLLM